MALYLLIRDHMAHSGAVEVGWRVDMIGGYTRGGDVMFSYHASVENMLVWARHPSRRWQDKIPIGIIDVRDTFMPEHKLFASVPVLDRVVYYMLDPYSMDEMGALAEPGDVRISRRTVLNAAFGAPAGVGSVRDRLTARVMDRMNKPDYWAEYGVWPNDD